MKKLIFLLAMVLLSGCITEKRCSRKFPPVTIIKDSISVKETTIFRDTTVFVLLPKDTIKYSDTVYIKNNVCFMPAKYLKNGIISAQAEVQNSRLNLSAWINDSGIFYTLNDVVRESQRWEFMYHSQQVVKEVNRLSRWQKVQIWLGRVFILCLFACVVIFLTSILKKVT